MTVLAEGLTAAVQPLLAVLTGVWRKGALIIAVLAYTSSKQETGV
jgi:hypothetical protein